MLCSQTGWILLVGEVFFLGKTQAAEPPDAMLQPVRWGEGCVELIDQTLLPGTYTTVRCTTVDEVAAAIKDMTVRGAPAIGITAAYGYALAAFLTGEAGVEDVLAEAYAVLVATRPTAVNLAWALNRMRSTYNAAESASVDELRTRLLAEARKIHRESLEADRAIGRWGADLLAGRTKILTHCNAGPLATAGYGTAIGVIRTAFDGDSQVSVLVDETRPLLQGARLTAWELVTLGIPATLITDNMAAYMMASGEVHAVIVGADRVAANGDVANKIGTYGLAVLADAHDIPFYVAAPTSTVDLDAAAGEDIPIEQRNPDEVTQFRGVRTAPVGMSAANPAFDITPSRLVTAIITENGVARDPYLQSLRSVMGGVLVG
jgi:methylthioribose-1-phosphate isomerase